MRLRTLAALANTPTEQITHTVTIGNLSYKLTITNKLANTQTYLQRSNKLAVHGNIDSLTNATTINVTKHYDTKIKSDPTTMMKLSPRTQSTARQMHTCNDASR